MPVAFNGMGRTSRLRPHKAQVARRARHRSTKCRCRVRPERLSALRGSSAVSLTETRELTTNIGYKAAQFLEQMVRAEKSDFGATPVAGSLFTLSDKVPMVMA